MLTDSQYADLTMRRDWASAGYFAASALLLRVRPHLPAEAADAAQAQVQALHAEHVRLREVLLVASAERVHVARAAARTATADFHAAYDAQQRGICQQQLAS